MTTSILVKQAVTSLNILVVEDDVLMTKLYKDLLECMGFGKVKVARAADEALQEIQKINYDLIICDWKLSGMSGLDFVKYLRAIPNYEVCNVPIIMISGKATIEDIQLARDAGITEYIAKPFTIKALCDKVRAIVENPRRFVLAESFKGPDRRRKKNDLAIQERRSYECAI